MLGAPPDLAGDSAPPVCGVPRCRCLCGCGSAGSCGQPLRWTGRGAHAMPAWAAGKARCRLGKLRQREGKDLSSPAGSPRSGPGLAPQLDAVLAYQPAYCMC